MKMADITSRTWTKVAEIPTEDFSIDGIIEAIDKEFGEQIFDDILNALSEGYIEIADDGIIVWES